MPGETVSERPPTGEQWAALVRVVTFLARQVAPGLSPQQRETMKAMMLRAGVTPPRVDIDTFDGNWF